ncbi:MAG TPA: hypothetical protein PKJ08_09095 [Candidatus Cloacimonadota bacterium]|nr:hypothetical protein [Candidatus Cloacimonadota bacterium]
MKEGGNYHKLQLLNYWLKAIPCDKVRYRINIKAICRDLRSEAP